MVFPVTNSAVPTGTHSMENSLATIKSVRHTSTRVCLYFSLGRWSTGTQWHKPSILVVMGTSSKDDHQVVAYAFLKKFPDFLGI